MVVEIPTLIEAVECGSAAGIAPEFHLLQYDARHGGISRGPLSTRACLRRTNPMHRKTIWSSIGGVARETLHAKRI